MNIRHSGNTGSVGWSCISLWLTPMIMRLLRGLQPKGYFTPCFYVLPEHGSNDRTVRTQEGFEAYVKNPKYYSTGGHYYFTFPCNERSLRMLKILRVPLEPEYKTWGK